MAKPRIFISSTYYDLKNVRADLERFIKERGFDPILHERGHVAYGKKEALEEYCYKEIDNCDILIAVIGGRFGSASKHEPYSISQIEFKTATELQKPIYIFVERDVLAEHKTYSRNKEATVDWAAVNDVRVYHFLDEIFALSSNNSVAPFETSLDITSFLQEQWASLFHRLLKETSQQEQIALIREMREGIETLKQLVTHLLTKKDEGSEAITYILLMNHPVFARLQKIVGVKYRVFFTNRNEFEAWLRARSYKRVREEQWDDPSVEEWINTTDKKTHSLLQFDPTLFDDDGKLVVITPEQWNDERVLLKEISAPQDDNDIPF